MCTSYFKNCLSHLNTVWIQGFGYQMFTVGRNTKKVKIQTERQMICYSTDLKKQLPRYSNNLTWLICNLVRVECADGGREWLRGPLKVEDWLWGSSISMCRLFWGEFFGVGDSDLEFMPPPPTKEKESYLVLVKNVLYIGTPWSKCVVGVSILFTPCTRDICSIRNTVKIR
jgi:hypothetical protein